MRLALCAAVSVAALCAGVGRAEELNSRPAQAVQPRFSEPVKPRHPAPEVRREAGALPDRAEQTTAPADGGSSGAGLSRWRWQTLADTRVASDGLARGAQLRAIRCGALACRVFQDTAGDWTIRAEARFADLGGQTVAVVLLDDASRRPAAQPRQRGVFSDGSFWDQVPTWKLPAGSYTVLYRLASGDRVIAAVRFEVGRAPTTADERAGTAGAGTGAGGEARQRLIDAARQRQSCLAIAAGNPDVRCELGR